MHTQQITERVRDFGSRFFAGRNAHEGKATKAIESVTASIPSSTWMVLAGGAIVGALVLKLMKKHETANFVGEWAPTILLLGLYNKLVKVMGSERSAHAR